MSQINLTTRYLENGIENVNFFNGRILTGQDLQDEQKANRQQHQQLGKAIGSGVVHGLTVSIATAGENGATPVIAVSAGLAINRVGHALELPLDVKVNLIPQEEIEKRETGLFAICTPVETELSATALGAYVLLMSPASDFRGQALKSGLGDEGKASNCGFRYLVEGVQFKLVRLVTENLIDDSGLFSDADLAVPTDKDDWTGWSRLRNVLAYSLFHLNVKTVFSKNPFELRNFQFDELEYHIQDRLSRFTGGVINDCDMPLALIFWTQSGIRFIDVWSVRRRLLQPVVSPAWPLNAGHRFLAGQEAIFLQFQEQLDWLRSNVGNKIRSLAAIEYFRFLPPVGYLPLGANGIEPDNFFTGISVDQDDLDSAFWHLLFHQSLLLDPLDLKRNTHMRTYRKKEQDPIEYLLFVRAEEQVPAEESLEEEVEESPEPSIKIGRILVTVDATGIDKNSLRGLVFNRNLSVWAEDRSGKKYPARPIRKTDGIGSFISKEIGVLPGQVQITGLTPGFYRVRLKAKGFRDQSKDKNVAAGGTTRVVFKLSKKAPGKGPVVIAPGKNIPGKELENGWYDKLHLHDEKIRWPWPPEEWKNRDPVIDPIPEKVDLWLKEWADWIGYSQPDTPIDPGDIQIYIDPAHIPGVLADQPYAYVSFGDGGAYAPLTLIPADKSTGRAVPIDKVGLSGVDRETAARLETAGLGEIDVLAASWRGAVADALGVGLEAGGTLIVEASERVDDFQDGLMMFSGVDAELDGRLSTIEVGDGLSLDNPVALANADPQFIVDQLAESGVTISLGFAQRLVDEARSVVPASEWSLREASLGLKVAELAKLEKAKVRTKGALARLGRTEDGKAKLGELLEINADKVDQLVKGVKGGLVKAKVKFLAAPKNSAPVTKLFGITRERGKLLAKLGAGSMAKLATGDAARLAPAFNGDVAAAEKAIKDAVGFIGL